MLILILTALGSALAQTLITSCQTDRRLLAAPSRLNLGNHPPSA
ncbi:MAG: hypothetical protein ACYC0C_00110 [Devosia sp.]